MEKCYPGIFQANHYRIYFEVAELSAPNLSLVNLLEKEE